MRAALQNAVFASILLLIAIFSLTSCSEQPTGGQQETVANHTTVLRAQSSTDRRLQELLRKRSSDAFSSKLAVGPGDVIEITVTGVPELDKYRTRVSEDDTIAVPLAGVVPVGGLTEEELRQALYERLEKPMKDPQVEVFVVQYHSREVAVVGMVQKAGLYSITSRSDTILDMIDRAGGMTDQASSRLLFIPASASGNEQRLALAKALSAPSEQIAGKIDPIGAAAPRPEKEMAEQRDKTAPDSVATDPADNATPGSMRLVSLLGASDPIEVDLTSGARELTLSIPVRPGDAIIVPAAGEVMVDGWVANPGAFHIVLGMTALSAVSAAGGALFSQTAEVLRTNPDGSRRSILVDLSKVKAGEEADVPVEAGDIVFVRQSAIGAVPYAFYEIFKKFGTGMYLPPP
jgi:protein involved in polysaccharide export with SLBB domain